MQLHGRDTSGHARLRAPLNEQEWSLNVAGVCLLFVLLCHS